jgi:hypothetical protein
MRSARERTQNLVPAFFPGSVPQAGTAGRRITPMFSRIAVIAAMCGFALLAAAPTAAAPVQPDKKDKDIAKLVERLGLADATAVDDAVKRLTAAGPAALPALRDAAEAMKKDTSTRAKWVIDAIEANAKKVVTDRLAKFNAANGAALSEVDDRALQKLFPTYLFYTVIYRQYPVGRVPPNPLKVRNVFIVGPDKELKHVTDVKGLLIFFRSTLAPVKQDKEIEEVVHAWLSLGVTFYQDGFFRFSIPKDGATVTKEDKGKKAAGKAEVVKQGGNSGDVQVTMHFNAEGKLATVDQVANLRAGIRPICQATKLLDPDPIVRQMAEKDILVMGRAAKDYLDEQRARARPELRRAIDHIWKRIVEDGW